MSLTLHAAFVPSCLQILAAQSRLIDKAEAFCAEQGMAPPVMLEARLADDMLPYAYQVKSLVVHSLGAIGGVRQGRFSPDMSPLPASFADLKALVDKGAAALQTITPDEIEGFMGRDMCFVMGDFRMDFTAEDFLLSFSQPNFYFHATTAYDILRWKGLDIGKRDFAGRPRIKAAA